MELMRKYFLDIFKQASELLGGNLTIVEEQEDYFAIEVGGVGFECMLLPVDEERVILRTYVDVINAGVFRDNMLEVYDIMNKFNLQEGGLFKLVAIENEEAEYMTICLKSMDIIITKELMENGDVRYYHLNIIADILSYVNVHELYNEMYLSKIDEYNEIA